MAEVQKSAQAGEMAQQFVQFVMLQAQNILFVLGKIPTPEGTVMQPNLQAAKMLIDQLEMIRFKTQGNLSKQESKILDETISSVQLAFVEASGGTPASMMPKPSSSFDMPKTDEDEEGGKKDKKETASKQKPEEPSPEATAADDDDKKKFFKSYG